MDREKTHRCRCFQKQGFFDVKTLPDGEVGLIWLEGKGHHDTKSIGSTLLFSKTLSGTAFTEPKIISTSVCQCCKTKLAVDSKKQIHIVFRKILEDGARDMVYIHSKDNGISFTSPLLISPDNWIINGCPHVGPDMAVTAKGLNFIWFSKGSIYGNASFDNGKTFTSRKLITGANRPSHPQIAALANGTLAMVWDEVVEVNGKPLSRIGIQSILPDGKIKNSFLQQKEDTQRPVVASVDKETIFVAFTSKSKNASQIHYQTMKVRD